MNYYNIGQRPDMDYQTWLTTKIQTAQKSGFFVSDEDLHPSNFGHQSDAVKWSLELGRALIAFSFGLGKTQVQTEIARLVHEQTGGRFLIVCPLGVKHQFIEEDGPRLGVNYKYVRTDEEVEAADTPFLVTNYERVRDGQISPDLFVGVSLDEGSVLRSFGSKTYQLFIDIFQNVPYRYVSTATPSPNRYKELIHYAGFLGIMDTGQALTRWFKRDSTKANHLTIHPHHEKDFWMWVASWALFVDRPSDLGYSDEGYDLPPLQVYWHRLPVDHRRAWRETDNHGQRFLFADSAVSLQAASREKRESIEARLDKALELIDDGAAGDHWLLWHHLESERHAIKKAIPEAEVVYGSQDLEKRENLILDFSRGKYRILATKPEIAGSGCNFQRHCHKNIFLGVNYKFNDFIQAVHRTYRFQQDKPVEIHIIYMESEDQIIAELRRKWERHDKLVERMRQIVKQYNLSDLALRRELGRKMGIDRYEIKGDLFTAVNNDCVEELQLMPDDSVDLIHTSIPFGNHYEYSASYNDFGHNEDDERFFEQMSYLVPELLRVLRPGRVAAIHVKDRIMYGNVTGLAMPSLNPFSDKTVAAFARYGFVYFGRITVVTDVVRENNQTYRLGWSEQCKDGTKMGVGSPEYVLLFRKLPSDLSNAYADEPVSREKESYTRAQWQIDAHSLWRSSGDRPLTPEEIRGMGHQDIIGWWNGYNSRNIYDYHQHVAIGEGLEADGKLPASFMLFQPQAPDVDHVWTDVNRMRTLNGEQSKARMEQHICPLQFDIVERIIHRYSNPDDLVLDPFAGIGTVPFKAIEMGRRGYGIELNAEYFDMSLRYLKAAERQAKTPSLFDLLGIEKVTV